jgi:type IV pilus assembly protein PilY1
MTRKLAVVAVAAAVAVSIAVPIHLLADVSSCSLATASYADAIINPPSGEDTDFFVTSGGVPNLMFLIDNSGSMMNMPPDGAADTWGSFEATAISTTGYGYGCTNTYANSLVYNSPCGTTTYDGSPFNPTPGSTNLNDYYNAKDASGNYCPYMVSGNQPPATDKPGFDPDFPNYFARDSIYKDTSGWSISGPSATSTSTATYCSTSSWSAAKQASCAACMRDQGYWFEGTYGTSSNRACAKASDCALHGEGVCVGNSGATSGFEINGTSKTGVCKLPNIYFQGNFLNFYPPKFIVARKVFKDVLQSVRRVRLGVATFNNTYASNKGPDQKLNPGCNQFGTPSQFDSNRSSLLSWVNNLSFPNSTPLAETLFNVGQYYRTSTLPWFNNTYKAGWDEGSANQKSVCFTCQASAVLVITDGLPNRDSKIPGTDFAATPMSASVANAAGSYAGMAGYNITGISTADCPECETWAELADTAIANGSCNGNQDSGACDDSGNPVTSYLPRVAWYLKNMDFRSNAEADSVGALFTGKQSITTYTIGLGTRGAATEILRHTADMGGGLFNGGTGADIADVKSLKQAILNVLQDVNTRSTSFGAASVSTLQVQATQGVLVPRFSPARAAHWDGHLYSFLLFSEFTSGEATTTGKVRCTPGLSPSGPANGDYDCDGKCESVFLVDKNGAFISEDGTGAFRENLNVNLATCGSTNQCGAGNCSTANPSVPAVAFWDAGSKLAPIKTSTDPTTGVVTESPNAGFASGRLDWNLRKIFTVIDRNGDGKLTAADMPLVDLRTADPATLVPYLNLKGSSYCSKLSQRLGALGNPVSATIDSEVASGTYTTCARMLLNYVRGADIFNERAGDSACSSYPSATNPSGTYCTRKYQLGDIFHSSPAEIHSPYASDGFLCSAGLATQCLPSLFTTTIPEPSLNGYVHAYDDFQKSSRYGNRARFVLAGANDGMLHAFQDELYLLTGAVNPYAGEEIWAFIPPDLLPKLRLLTETVHQFYVDGSPMIREVWIDGDGGGSVKLNKLNGGGSRAADGKRQGDEFHTVAVVGERRGGTHYFALDVTDASHDLDAQPSFLWVYPQPNDPEQLQFGETYTEFVPIAPPIGPVRLDRGAPPCTGNYPTFNGSGTSRCFEERYVAFLSGGFDPAYTRGRGVHMVDVATGEEIWDFSQPPGTAGTSCTATSDPRCHLNYPVAAPVGMMAWGTSETYLNSNTASVDLYFDTATFGDTGGQLWVVRFSDPGQAGTDGWTPGSGRKVTNWFGARVYQNGLGSSTPACGLDYCGGQPFFYITANVPLVSTSSLYRVLAGTGDRFNLLDPVGGTCGPDNLRACLIKGCTVTLKDASGNAGAVYGVEPLLGTQAYKMNSPSLCASTPISDFTYTASTGGGPTCATTVIQKVDTLSISCPSSVTCSGNAESTFKKASVVCTGNSCDPAASNDFGSLIDLKGNPDKLNQFFSITVFESTGPRKIFRTLSDATTYDGARLKDSDLTDVTSGAVADPAGKGWRYVFSHGEVAGGPPVSVVIDGVAYNIYRTDERNASVGDVQNGCGVWNTMQAAVPSGAFDSTSECPVNSPCKAGKSQLSYFYGGTAGTGELCIKDMTGALVRSIRNDTLVPPQMGKLVTYVSDSQVTQGLTSVRVPSGGQNITTMEAQDLASQYQWIPIDRKTHKCRHATTAPSPDDCK